MKALITLITLALFQCSILDAQEQRIRKNTGHIPDPSEYWEELKPMPMAYAKKVHPVSKRTKPRRTPIWQNQYTLGPGDTLTFSIYNRPDLERKDVQIAPDGTVSYLQAVAVKASGLTLDQLRNKLETELAKYQEARVIITPGKISSKDFAIIGRVQKPGSYTLERPTSVLEAIARAEGIQVGNLRQTSFELADLERSFVARGGNKLDVDLARLYYEGDFSQNAFLEPNDYIYIASSLENEIYVLGEVPNPGRRKMPSKLTLAQAIGEAGGFGQYAFKKKVLLIRGSIHNPETQIVDMNAILRGHAKDIKLQNRDIIFVNKRPFELVERALDSAILTFVQTVTNEYMNQNYTSVLLGNDGNNNSQ